jgi:A/G-specific adenine glycosylase
MNSNNGSRTHHSPAWRRSLASNLLNWFDRTARDLPWRRTRDLYAIWISEIMLQQTQVATVIPYWKRFMALFPDVAALAAASEHDVLKLWEGLGYYRRARQLHAAAKQIAKEHSGQFPTTYDDVRALPGIGRYTAGAILSIGLDQRLPILEANSIRVLSRLTAYRGDPRASAGQKLLWLAAEAILPTQQCGKFNQALMELGSEICTPKAPDCPRCPIASHCVGHERGLADRIPASPKPKKFEDVTEIAVVLRRGNRILLRHCQPGERWAGLWDFPRFPAAKGDDKSHRSQISRETRALVGCDVATAAELTILQHGVTRFRITLHCYVAALRPNSKPPKNATGTTRWVRLTELADYPLSTTGRKISRLLSTTPRKLQALAPPPQHSRHTSC